MVHRVYVGFYDNEAPLYRPQIVGSPYNKDPNEVPLLS